MKSVFVTGHDPVWEFSNRPHRATLGKYTVFVSVVGNNVNGALLWSLTAALVTLVIRMA